MTKNKETVTEASLSEMRKVTDEGPYRHLL